MSFRNAAGGRSVTFHLGPSPISMVKNRNHPLWRKFLQDAIDSGECWGWGYTNDPRDYYYALSDEPTVDASTNTDIENLPMIIEVIQTEAPPAAVPPTKAPPAAVTWTKAAPTHQPPQTGKAPKAPPPELHPKAVNMNQTTPSEALEPPPNQPPLTSKAPQPPPPKLHKFHHQKEPDEVIPYKACPRRPKADAPRSKPPPLLRGHPPWVQHCNGEFDRDQDGEFDRDQDALCRMGAREDKEGGWDKHNAETFPDAFPDTNATPELPGHPMTPLLRKLPGSPKMPLLMVPPGYPMPHWIPATRPPLPITNSGPKTAPEQDPRHEPAPEPSVHHKQQTSTPPTMPEPTNDAQRLPATPTTSSSTDINPTGPGHNFFYKLEQKSKNGIVFERWVIYAQQRKEARLG